MKTKRYLFEMAVVIALGAVVRFWGLDLFSWGGDQLEAFNRAIDFAVYGHFPSRGLDASTGTPNPPGFIWLVALAAAIKPTPLFATGFITLLAVLTVPLTALAGSYAGGRRAGVHAAALFALSPWAVAQSRSLWAQFSLPFFSSLVLLAMALWLKRPRGRWLAAMCLVGFFMPQVHFSAVAVQPVILLAAWLGWRRWRVPLGRKAVIASAIAGVTAALWVPYVLEMKRIREDRPSRESRLNHLDWIENAPAGTPAPYVLPPEQENIILFPNVISQTLSIHSADYLERWVGEWNWTMHVHQNVWKTYGVVAGFALLVSMGTASGFWRRRRGPRSPRAQYAALLAIWLISPAVALALRIQTAPWHYFAVCFPSGFLLMGRHAELLRRTRGARWLERRFYWLILACLAFGGVFLVCMAGEILVNRGFPEGEYGIAFRFLK